MLKTLAKTIGLPALGLMAALVFAAPQANAAVRFGIGIGGPVYAPAVPVAPYTAPAPYAYGPYGNPVPYAYPSPYYTAPYPAYVAPGPYVAPYGGFGFGWGGHNRVNVNRGWGGGYSHGYRGGFHGRRR